MGFAIPSNNAKKIVEQLEKFGRTHELDELYDKLSPYGIMQFVRSGRIAVTKKPMMISEILSKFKTN